MNIPNTLTIIRLCMMPVFLLVYFMPDSNAKWWAMGVIVFAFLTDILDGFIARRYHQVTDLGKILDPVADKVMQITVLVCIVIHNLSLLWVVLFIFIKEVLLGIGAVILYRRGMVGQANCFGKVACFVNVVVSVVLLFPFSPPLPDFWIVLMSWLLVMANALALVSYFITFVRALRS